MPNPRSQLGFIGGGKLAGSVMRGLLTKRFCQPSDILVSEPNATMRETLRNELGVQVTGDNAELAGKTEQIFLGVKPQMVLPILRELGPALADKLVASFAAGIRIASMEEATPGRVLRVMTNTPSAIGRAATAFAFGTRSTAEDREKIRALFESVGAVVEVQDDQIDAVTALAGSGPAFVYSMIEALAAGGERMGLPKEAALTLAAQTALGAADLALTSGKSPDELRTMVVTPGGTTAAGLEKMESLGAGKAISAAVEAAAVRGAQMAREFGA